jgi:hypothetical protein
MIFSVLRGGRQGGSAAIAPYKNFMLSSLAGREGRLGGSGLTDEIRAFLVDPEDDDDDDDEESDPSSPSFDEAAGLDRTCDCEGLRFGCGLDLSTSSRCCDV